MTRRVRLLTRCPFIGTPRFLSNQSNANWTDKLVPFVSNAQDLMSKHLEHSPTVPWNASALLPELYTLCATPELSCTSTASALPIPGDSEDEFVVNSLRLLAFVQSAVAVVGSISNERERHAVLKCSMDILVNFGVYMMYGRTAATAAGMARTEVTLMPKSVPTPRIEAQHREPELASSLLHSTMAILRAQPEISVRNLQIFRVLLKQVVVQAPTLTVSELCDLAEGLALTHDASVKADEGSGSNSSGGSFEDHGDWVVFAGEVVSRLAHQTQPSVAARKQFGSSSKFVFSLKEKKARELQEASKEAITQDQFCVGDLAQLSTSFAVSQFRDASFTAHNGSVGSTVLWSHVAQATVKLVTDEMTLQPQMDEHTSVLDVSFTRKELQSICFACDFVGQHDAYHSIMSCLVHHGIVGSYLTSPSGASAANFQERGVAFDARGR